MTRERLCSVPVVLADVLGARGEGISVLRARPMADRGAAVMDLEARGWTATQAGGTAVATHQDVPFAVWVV